MILIPSGSNFIIPRNQYQPEYTRFLTVKWLQNSLVSPISTTVHFQIMIVWFTIDQKSKGYLNSNYFDRFLHINEFISYEIPCLMDSVIEVVLRHIKYWKFKLWNFNIFSYVISILCLEIVNQANLGIFLNPETCKNKKPF